LFGVLDNILPPKLHIRLLRRLDTLFLLQVKKFSIIEISSCIKIEYIRWRDRR
jgi:hypothetical protein